MLEPADAAPLPETLDAIAAADLITLGPGSLYTSLITQPARPRHPRSSRGLQRHARLHLQPHDAGQRIASASPPRSTSKKSSTTPATESSTTPSSTPRPSCPATLAQYAREGQMPIEPDLDRIRALGVEPITGNFVHEGEVLRHDYDHVAQSVLHLAMGHAHN